MIQQNSVEHVSVVGQGIHQRLQVFRYRGNKVHRFLTNRMPKVEFDSMQCLARVLLQEGYGFDARPPRYDSATTIGGIAHQGMTNTLHVNPYLVSAATAQDEVYRGVSTISVPHTNLS